MYSFPALGEEHRTGQAIYKSSHIQVKPYIYTDVSINKYLQRLKERGEDPDDYRSIWYYY